MLHEPKRRAGPRGHRSIGAPCCGRSRHLAGARRSRGNETRAAAQGAVPVLGARARGHVKSLLGTHLTGARDGVGAYYRSRPLLLALGLSLHEALASTMMRAGGMSEGRDIGVVFNLPRRKGACVLPVVRRRGHAIHARGRLGSGAALPLDQCSAMRRCAGSIAVAHGGDASTATNGFWAALNIVTTERLPYLFFIEDNGYGISVPSQQQTPGGNIARNLAAFGGLRVLDGDGSDPMAAAALIEDAVRRRAIRRRPGVARLVVPRLSGHSGQDTQAYKSAAEIAAEARARSRCERLARAARTGGHVSAGVWESEMSRGRRMAIVGTRDCRGRPRPRSGARQALSVLRVPAPTAASNCSSKAAYCADGFVPPPGIAAGRPQGPAHQSA